MGLNVVTAVRFTRLSVYLAHSWPSSSIKTKWDSLRLDLMWVVSILSSLGLLGPLLVSIYVHKSNSLILTQSACFVGAICNFIVKTFVYRIQRDRTRMLIHEMEDFLKRAKTRETKVLQRYVDRSMIFHTVITFVNYMTAVVVICGPAFLPQRFPTEAVYPFSVDSSFARYVVYAHQSLVGFQCSTGATIDCQTALMMWYAGARLELLANELKYVNDVRQFRCFVRKHQRLLWYAQEVSRTMRYIALTTSIMGGLGVVFSGLQLISNQPLGVKMQFAPIVLVAGMNLFVCSWPADNLITVCHMMGTAVYDASWINLSPIIMKNYLMILRRSQRPVVVSVGGFLPTLSLRSYASVYLLKGSRIPRTAKTRYLSAAFSYTTTLRLIVSSEPEN